ncbi:nucleotidyltransferase domain-containing protein [Candidatus Saganbacteria bacterium CG08_land_8_20_14_0_20_45_16]|uniref:Nucleotidyltransferase domain-containing protein n=1 Tax=Candidatus Saganbacteria bacterium CG08_land_8_20_14_0_20_45_16 TaxID=2014293 RepID=A0A2H0Y465_UNCSA|nr:MAG: nucleotidyltransferase domain-containing protein [Candidatus Saganbacteria bacterium CG08_land_8_20_14_0_20_45_16]
MGNQLENLKNFFKNKQNISLAFLFGSQAKGKASSRSDFDIAIWPTKELSRDEFNHLWQELESLLQTEVDLILLPEARPTVAWSALRGKKLLIKNYAFYLKKLLEISSEAEDMQDFIIDLFRLREKQRKQGAGL